jgi:hypothetical protein
VAVLQRHARAAELLDFNALARQAGTAISAVLLGAVAASGVLPIARGVFEDTIRASGKGVDASLRGFALAFDAVTTHRAQQAQLDRPWPRHRRPTCARWPDSGWPTTRTSAYAELYDAALARIGRGRGGVT